MKIERIKLKNFRGLTNMGIQLDGKTTVLFGVNGVGKSSILSSINIVFAKLLTDVTRNKYENIAEMQASDLSVGSDTASISVTFNFNGESFDIMKKSSDPKDEFQENIPSILAQNDFSTTAAYFEYLYLKDECANMPIFVHYGANRAVLDIQFNINEYHSFNKMDALENAIENKVDFKTFFEWFRNQEDYENELKAQQGIQYTDKSLECVRNSIYEFLEGFSNLRVQRNGLKMTVLKDGHTLSIKEQLSAGEKCTIALIGDLARRLALANPSLENPLLGQGIVLIDEIELHMHPSWQRTVVNKLHRLFPNIQFIVTTHSPQVLGEFGEDVNIFKMEKKGEETQFEKINSLVAWDANLILEGLMETASMNNEVKVQIKAMFAHIEQTRFDEAEEIADEIDRLSNGYNTDTVKARILIMRGRRKNEAH